MFAKMRARRQSAGATAAPPAGSTKSKAPSTKSRETSRSRQPSDVESRFSFSPDHAPVPRLPLSLATSLRRRSRSASPTRRPSLPQNDSSDFVSPLQMTFDFEGPSDSASDFGLSAERAGLVSRDGGDPGFLGGFEKSKAESARAPSPLSEGADSRSLNGYPEGLQRPQIPPMRSASYDTNGMPPPNAIQVNKRGDNEKTLGKGSETRNWTWSQPGNQGYEPSPLAPLPQGGRVAGVAPHNDAKSSFEGRPSLSESMASANGSTGKGGVGLSAGEMDLMNIGGGTKRQNTNGRSRPGTAEGKRSTSIRSRTNGAPMNNDSVEAMTEEPVSEAVEQESPSKLPASSIMLYDAPAMQDAKPPITSSSRSASKKSIGKSALSPFSTKSSKSTKTSDSLPADSSPTKSPRNVGPGVLTSETESMQATMFPPKAVPQTQASSTDALPPMSREFVDMRDRAYSQPRPKSGQSTAAASASMQSPPAKTILSDMNSSPASNSLAQIPPPPSSPATFANWNQNSSLSPPSANSASASPLESSDRRSSINGNRLRPRVSTNTVERPPSITGAMLSPRFSPGRDSPGSLQNLDSTSDRPVSGISLHPSVLRQMANSEPSPAVPGSRQSWASGSMYSQQTNRHSGHGDSSRWQSASPPIPEVPKAMGEEKTAQESSTPVSPPPEASSVPKPTPLAVSTLAPPPSIQSPLSTDGQEVAPSPSSLHPPTSILGLRSKKSASSLNPEAAKKTLKSSSSSHSLKTQNKLSKQPPSPSPISPTIGMSYDDASQSFPLPQHVATRPKNGGVTSSVAGVSVPTHHTTSQKVDNKSEKRKTRMLNPMSFLGRRKTGNAESIIKPSSDELLAQEQALAKQRAVAAKGVDTLPADFDPRIKGKVVHDFSAPKRATRNFSYSEKEVFVPPGHTSSQPVTAVSSPIASNFQDTNDVRRSVHSPVFREHIDDNVNGSHGSSVQAERLENKDFLKRASRHSMGSVLSQDDALAASTAAALPPFARRSQAFNMDSTQSASFANDSSKDMGGDHERRVSDATITNYDRQSRASGFVSPMRNSVLPNAAARNSFSPVSPASLSFPEGSGRHTRASNVTDIHSDRYSGQGASRNSGDPSHIHRRGPSAEAPEAIDTSNSQNDFVPSNIGTAISEPTRQDSVSIGTNQDPHGKDTSREADLDASESSRHDGISLAPPEPWAIRVPSPSASVETPELTPEVDVGTQAMSGRTPKSPPRLVEKRASAAGHSSRNVSGMKHNVSNASRFSFQFGGSAVEEGALEEKGRKVLSTTQNGDGEYEDDEDYFDEDAMDDMDEMELEGHNEDDELPDMTSSGHAPGLLTMRRRLILSDASIGSSNYDESMAPSARNSQQPVYGMHPNPTFHSLSALALKTPPSSDYSQDQSIGGALGSDYTRTIGHMRFASDDSDATLGTNKFRSSTLGNGQSAASPDPFVSDGAFGSSPPVAYPPQRPPLPHRDSGNSERNRVASGLAFGHSNSDEIDVSSHDQSAGSPLPVEGQPKVNAPRNTMMPPPVGSGFDDMYFDDGGFEQDITRPRSSENRMNEEEFDNPAFLARPGNASRTASHQRDNSGLTSSSMGDGPYPSFAMGANADKVLKRQSQMLLEDLALQNGPTDPKLIPQRNPSEDAKRLGLSDRVPPLPPPPGSKEAYLAKVQNNLFAYHATLAEAANKAEAQGRFMRRFPSVSTARSSMYSHIAESIDDEGSTYSRDEHDEMAAYRGQTNQSMPRPVSKGSTGSRAQNNVSYSPGKMGFDFGFDDRDDQEFMHDTSMIDDYDGGDDDEYDDIIAAANAEALSIDTDGFYGQEFGFYAKARPHAAGEVEAINGGFFGADGDDGLTRNKASEEPNLTPITERSEFSTRNSFIGGPFSSVPPSVPNSAMGLSSPMTLAHLPTSPLMENDVTSFEQLRKLRASAFGAGNSGPLPNDPASRSMPPYSHHRRRSSAGSSGLITTTIAEGPTISSNIPAVVASSSAPSSAHPGAAEGSGLPPNGDIWPKASPASAKAVLATGVVSSPTSLSFKPSHSRNGSDSVTYVREHDPSGNGQPRWVVERRRTSEQGQQELVGREVVQDGWI